MALFHRRYNSILATPLSITPPCRLPTARKGCRKRRPGRNPALSRQTHRDPTLRSLTDLTVPFTNSREEQGLRMMKMLQNISGDIRRAQPYAVS